MSLASPSDLIPKGSAAVASRYVGKPIDPHVHFRDEEQSFYTIRKGRDEADRQGVGAVVDMPNTKRPRLTVTDCEARMDLARKEGVTEGYYIYVGVTSDPDQIREAVKAYSTIPGVVGIKLYAGRSTGNLAVTNREDLRTVFRILKLMGYEGPVMIHAESVDLEFPSKWDPEKPASWNEVKPPGAEIRSIIDLIGIIPDSGFAGHVHICHITTPWGVMLVNDAKSWMKISCGATPHHMTLSTLDMEAQVGVKYKVNPPLRDHVMMMEMRELLKQGKIDWIESDHAPHPASLKTYNKGTKPEDYASGIPSLERYAVFLTTMRDWGISSEQIDAMTYGNIRKVLRKIKE